MKNKVLILNLAALLFASAAFAQSVENDDMYFNSSDRAKIKAQRVSAQPSYSASAKSKKSEVLEDVYINPTDTYSARNVNPEFAARSNSQTAQADDQDYFVNNYQYKTSSNLNNWNNAYSSMYNNPMYSSNYYGSSINSWNSPYYGSAYDSWGNPWCNPYYRSGWSSSFSYYMGSNWNYGWGGMGMGMGLSYGYGNYGYGYPYNAWGPSYGYGGGFYYPSTIVVVNNGSYGEAGHNIAYGKRATRGGTITSPQEVTSNRSRSVYVATPADSRTSDGGRVSSPGRSQSQADYYNRSWRNSQQNGTYPSRGSSSNSSWGGNSSNSYNRSGSFGQSNSSFSSPSRSSMSSGGGATRSSAPASSGSGGRSRGRD